jgi:hypothetical protein
MDCGAILVKIDCLSTGLMKTRKIPAFRLNGMAHPTVTTIVNDMI